MAITERSRHEMINRLETTLGKEAAMTLAEHLPPVGWADVATRHDLDALRTEMNLRFEAVDHRFEALEGRLVGEIHRTITRAVLANSAVVIAAVGLTAAIT